MLHSAEGMADRIHKQRRLSEFFRRLLASPPSNSGTEAMKLISDTLNAVEDELSGVPSIRISGRATVACIHRGATASVPFQVTPTWCDSAVVGTTCSSAATGRSESWLQRLRLNPVQFCSRSWVPTGDLCLA
jgi:hypothetical protein